MAFERSLSMSLFEEPIVTCSVVNSFGFPTSDEFIIERNKTLFSLFWKSDHELRGTYAGFKLNPYDDEISYKVMINTGKHLQSYLFKYVNDGTSLNIRLIFPSTLVPNKKSGGFLILSYPLNARRSLSATNSNSTPTEEVLNTKEVSCIKKTY